MKEPIDYVKSRIRRLMRKHHLPGVVVALIDDQDIIWQEAFGLANIEKNMPATLNTTYRVGSITKLFTAIEIMRLYEEGLLNLDAPITDYLPDFSIKTRLPESAPITIRSILAHRSGLPRNSNLPEWYWDAGTDIFKEMTKSIKNTYTAFPVGYRYKYSNLTFNILAQIIEDIRKALFPFYIKDNLLSPIGMKDSTFLSDQLADKDNIAMGYSYQDGKNNPLNQYDIIALASGNLYSTIGDICQFARFIFRGGEANGTQIIKQETLRMMFQEQYSRPIDPETHGLGWFTNRNRLSELVVSHSGGINGTSSQLMLMPDKKLGIVTFANSEGYEQYSISLSIKALELMLEARRGITPSKSLEAKTVKVDKSVLEKYTGKYIINGEVSRVFLSGNKLQATVQVNKLNLIPLSASKFKVKHWLVDIGESYAEFFTGDKDDAVMILTLEDAFHLTCPKYPEIDEIPPLWHQLTGKYDLHLRVKSKYSETEIIGDAEVKIVDNVLIMTGEKTIIPITETEIIIIGGPFDGETMLYDKDTGTIIWQNVIYKPV